MVLYIQYDLVLNNNIWQNKIVSCYWPNTINMKIIRIKKTRQKKIKIKLCSVSDLQDIIIEWCYYTFIMF